MKKIIRALKPDVLAISCIAALIVFFGASTNTVAQIQNYPPCTLQSLDPCELNNIPWSIESELLIRQGDCVFKIKYRQRKCPNGPCQYFFSQIERMQFDCCSGVAWPPLADLVKAMAIALANYAPSLGCGTVNGAAVVFPSCWKIITPNQFAQGCNPNYCCRYDINPTCPTCHVFSPVTPNTIDCTDGGSNYDPDCQNVCQ